MEQAKKELYYEEALQYSSQGLLIAGDVNAHAREWDVTTKKSDTLYTTSHRRLIKKSINLQMKWRAVISSK